jgi:hypothetical protein
MGNADTKVPQIKNKTEIDQGRPVMFAGSLQT